MLCKDCGQPMLPNGVKKLPNEYDHAQGCPGEKNAAAVALGSLGGKAKVKKGWAMKSVQDKITATRRLRADAKKNALAALRGSAPGATGELSSEAFVRKLRSEWNRGKE